MSSTAPVVNHPALRHPMDNGFVLQRLSIGNLKLGIRCQWTNASMKQVESKTSANNDRAIIRRLYASCLEFGQTSSSAVVMPLCQSQKFRHPAVDRSVNPALFWLRVQTADLNEVVKKYPMVGLEGVTENLLAQEIDQVGCQWARGNRERCLTG